MAWNTEMLAAPTTIRCYFALVLVMLLLFACTSPGPAPTPPIPTHQTPPTSAETLSVSDTPVPVDRQRSPLGEVLNSGLSVADVVANARPSIVQIVTDSGTGTGFIVDDNGLVFTNKHVVGRKSQVAVHLATGPWYRGTVVSRHPTLDLAYVRIDSDLASIPIALGDSDQVRVGEAVIAMGFPMGQTLGAEPTISMGIISADRVDYLQTDASLNPGNSGGPLLDTFGRAIAVVVSRIETDDSGRPISGIGFAIPINDARDGYTGQASTEGRVRSAPTPFPTIRPTPDLDATKAAIEAVDR